MTKAWSEMQWEDPTHTAGFEDGGGTLSQEMQEPEKTRKQLLP